QRPQARGPRRWDRRETPGRPRGRALHGQERRHARELAQRGAAVHDVDASAGGIAQARLLRETDDGPRTTALRGRLPRRGPRRPHHLHADRLAARGRGSVAAGARRDRLGGRRALRARATAPLQDAEQRRTGRARGDTPARFAEASLVKTLEEHGIGRPSTYAPTISTLIDRKYVRKDARALVPEDVGFVVTDFLREHFPDIVDTGFTARMEEDLDKIASG